MDATQGLFSWTPTYDQSGSYSVTWNGSGTSQYNFTCGKGWETGSEDRVVEYSGTFNPGNNGYLALYGWTENPVVEYYVVESYGSWTPPGATSQGTMTSDGATYNLYKIWRENQPWIKGGNGNFWQYWSVRTPKKSTGGISGTITFKNHVTAWRNKGWSLADFRYYQIMETEGWESSGNSSISVHEPVGNQPVPHPAPTNLKTIVQKHGIYRDVILNWTKPNSSRVKGYYVYIDDRKVASVFGTPAWGYQRVKPFDHHRYKFYVIALYVDGAVSEPSNIVTYKR